MRRSAISKNLNFQTIDNLQASSVVVFLIFCLIMMIFDPPAPILKMTLMMIFAVILTSVTTKFSSMILIDFSSRE